MATGLEHFVNNVRGLSNEGNFRELVNTVNRFSEILLRNNQYLDTVLETFEIQQHSLGVLAVLVAQATNYNANAIVNAINTSERFKVLLTQVQHFVAGCNKDQIKYMPDLYAELFHQVTTGLTMLRMPIRGIDMLCKAIRNIQTSESQLTAIHGDLCKLCLLAKCFKPALQFLDIDVTTISIDDDAKHFLLYFYYGGMIYTALKNYDRALYFYEVCVLTPASAVSHIMLEAYKKYILVSLILNGKTSSLPSYTSHLVKRHIKRLCLPYQELATAYGTNSCDDVQATISKYAEIFTRDNNEGLVKQVLSFLYKKNIQRLTNTFLTLSLSDVAARVRLPGPDAAETYILNMIEDGEIFATINQKDGMVIFHDDPEKYDSPRMLAKLEKEMAECAELGKKVLEMEEEVVVTPQYVRKALGQNEQDESAAGPAPTNITNAQNQPKSNTYSM